MNWVSLVETYLAQQRQLGYLLISEGHYLQNFALFAEQEAEQADLTVALALRWANLAPSGSNIAIARRFAVLRPFSRYLHIQGMNSAVLPSHYLGPTHRRLPPYIFSDSQILSLMDAAGKLHSVDGLRPITIRTLIGLLASTGLRPGEAVRLRSEDVDLSQGEVAINNSKGWRQRLIPLSSSTVDALKAYSGFRAQHNCLSQTGAFFEFDQCQPLDIRAADYAFQVLREATGLTVSLNGRKPRLYDLWHTFVCRRVIEWYKSGINVDCRVAQLSYYLGHKKVSDTYWYLTAIPELMSCAAARFSGKQHLGVNDENNIGGN